MLSGIKLKSVVCEMAFRAGGGGGVCNYDLNLHNKSQRVNVPLIHCTINTMKMTSSYQMFPLPLLVPSPSYCSAAPDYSSYNQDRLIIRIIN